LERETGIEPATNSLGSCDSTTELLPLNVETQASLTPGKDFTLLQKLLLSGERGIAFDAASMLFRNLVSNSFQKSQTLGKWDFSLIFDQGSGKFSEFSNYWPVDPTFLGIRPCSNSGHLI
jgi:hypothetical protein